MGMRTGRLVQILPKKYQLRNLPSIPNNFLCIPLPLLSYPILAWLQQHNDAYKELWTSSVISSDVVYRYLRFDVTNSGGTYSNANPKGEYCFTMSYFGITMIGDAESYTVELAPDAGDVTEELLLATYQSAQEAETIANRANTEKQLQAALQ